MDSVPNIYPGVAQLVGRLVWDQDAGSSSLPTRTNKNSNGLAPLLFLLISGDEKFIPLRGKSPHSDHRRSGLHIVRSDFLYFKLPFLAISRTIEKNNKE